MQKERTIVRTVILKKKCAVVTHGAELRFCL